MTMGEEEEEMRGRKREGGKSTQYFHCHSTRRRERKGRNVLWFRVERKNKGKTWHECALASLVLQIISLSLFLSCYSRKQKLNNREVIWPNWIVWRDKVQLIPGNCHEHEASSRYRNVGTSKRVRVD